MSGLCNHWMRPVGLALAGPRGWVSMDIGQDFQMPCLAKLPQSHEPGRVKHNDSGFERSFVKFVITNKMAYAADARLAQKKSAAFVRAVSAPTQLFQHAPPKQGWDFKCGRLHG